jgi:hypothetical protein
MTSIIRDVPNGSRQKPRRVIRGVGAAAIAAFVLYVVAQDHPLDRPCPDGFRATTPVAVHLAPTLIEHQSWVGLPRSQLGDDHTWVYACADGLALGEMKRDRVEFDSATGLAEVKIPTRWVDLRWLLGDLDTYRDPQQWALVYAPAD